MLEPVHLGLVPSSSQGWRTRRDVHTPRGNLRSPADLNFRPLVCRKKLGRTEWEHGERANPLCGVHDQGFGEVVSWQSGIDHSPCEPSASVNPSCACFNNHHPNFLQPQSFCLSSMARLVVFSFTFAPRNPWEKPDVDGVCVSLTCEMT